MDELHLEEQSFIAGVSSNFAIPANIGRWNAFRWGQHSYHELNIGNEHCNKLGKERFFDYWSRRVPEQVYDQIEKNINCIDDEKNTINGMEGDNALLMVFMTFRHCY